LFTLAAWRDRALIMERATADGAKVTALLYEQAQHLLSGHEIILNVVAERLRNQDWDTLETREGLLRELEAADTRLDDESEILLVDAEGRTRGAIAGSPGNGILPQADVNCFLALSRGETQSCIGRRHASTISGHDIFSLSHRLEKDGHFNGIAQVAISAGFIERLWASATPNPTDVVTLLLSDGAVLADTGALSGSEVAAQLAGWLTTERPGAATNGSLDVAHRISFLKGIAGYPVYISLSLDKAAILATWYGNLTVYGAVAAFATVGMVLALVIALRRAAKEREVVELWQDEVRCREASTLEQLYQSQKMESLGKLTGGIAHDFNNLLSVIVGNLSMIHECTIDREIQNLSRGAMHAARSAVSLTRRLLGFARKQVFERKPVDLLDLVEGMRALLMRTIKADVELTVSADADLWPAMVDSNQLELVILNLAINARDAMPNGGALSITLTNAEVAANAIGGLVPGRYVVLTVSDTGVGMDEATLARATEPFFTTKEPGRGTGLGLAMMQAIVTQCGGATQLRSELGRGTQITLWLPRATAEVEMIQDVRRHGCLAASEFV
jgi:signal transduction histidine kinase